MPVTDMKTYQRNWMKDRRKKYLDGKICYFCKTDQDIEIHHLDPEQKESHKIWSWSDERIVQELKKCIYLCPGCHRKFHALLSGVNFKHGTEAAYRKYGCRCDLCRASNNLHSRSKIHSANGFATTKENFEKIYDIDDSELNKLLFEFFGSVEKRGLG